MNISQMVNQGYSIETLKQEIDKCEVRRMNCHMKIEKERNYIPQRVVYWR